MRGKRDQGETMIESTKKKIWRWGLGMLGVAALSGALLGMIEIAHADEALAGDQVFTAKAGLVSVTP